MIKKLPRAEIRAKKHRRLRYHLSGTDKKPRLSVFRSNSHMYAQVIDDVAGNTICSASTTEAAIKSGLEKTNNIDAAKKLGAEIAKRAKEKGIEEVVFDRGGFIYAGKVAALADSAREAGLKF